MVGLRSYNCLYRTSTLASWRWLMRVVSAEYLVLGRDDLVSQRGSVKKGFFQGIKGLWFTGTGSCISPLYLVAALLFVPVRRLPLRYVCCCRSVQILIGSYLSSLHLL